MMIDPTMTPELGPDASELLAMDPIKVIHWLENFNNGLCQFSQDFAWLLLAEIARTRGRRHEGPGVNRTDAEVLQWAEVAVITLDHLSSDVISLCGTSGLRDGEGYTLQSMQLRAEMIARYGIIPGHPVLDMDRVVNWFFETVLISVQEAEEMASKVSEMIRDKTGADFYAWEQVSELDRIIKCTAVIIPLVQSGRLTPNLELSRWIALTRCQGHIFDSSTAAEPHHLRHQFLAMDAFEVLEWISGVFSGPQPPTPAFISITTMLITTASLRAARNHSMEWAKVATLLYEEVIRGATNPRVRQGFLTASMRVRAFLISRLGSITGDTVLDANDFPRWFFAELPFSFPEATRIAAMKPRTAAGWMTASPDARELFRQLIRLRERLMVLKSLADAGELPSHSALPEWLDLLKHLF